MKKLAFLFLLFSAQAFGACNPFTANTVLTAAALNAGIAAPCITSGTIAGSSITNTPISGNTGSFTTLTATSGVYVTNLLCSSQAPTISSGFGASAVVVTNNGTCAFEVNVGTGGTAASGVIGLPTAIHAWACDANDETTTSPTVFLTKQTTSTASSVTVTNYAQSGVSAAWNASDVLHIRCNGY